MLFKNSRVPTEVLAGFARALRPLIAKFSDEPAPYAIPGTIPLNRYYTLAVAH